MLSTVPPELGLLAVYGPPLESLVSAHLQKKSRWIEDSKLPLSVNVHMNVCVVPYDGLTSHSKCPIQPDRPMIPTSSPGSQDRPATWPLP